jgi:hypothetical protein
MISSTIISTLLIITPSLVNAEDSVSMRICEYTSINDKKRLRSFLKSRKIKVRSIFDSIQCNGQNLLVFSAEKNALDVGEFLIGKLPVKTVTENLPTITSHSAHLSKVANERIN